MYAYFKGIVTFLQEDMMILEVNQIGYRIQIARGSYGEDFPALGDEVTIYTYTCVREDTFSLYGFLRQEDLEIFKKLISVSGIGPKGGQAILSVMSADDLCFAIASGDAKAIAKAPGIGAKTAQRVILELRDKISLEDGLQGLAKGGEGVGQGQADLGQVSAKEAIEALTNWGYSVSEATKAVKQVATPEMGADEVLKAALKVL